MDIWAYINQPYPFYYQELKKVFLLLCGIALASFLFTYLFEPFVVNVTEHKINSVLIMVLHAVIPIPIAFIYFFFLTIAVKHTEHWTLGKEFVHLAILLLLIGITNFLIRDLIYTNPDNWSLRYLWEEIRNTFLVGTLLLSIILPLNVHRLIYKHQSASKILLESQRNGKGIQAIVAIQTQIHEENFNLAIHNFLYAKAEGNYLEIFNKNAKGVEKFLKRLPLKEFEEQLNAHPVIFRVHRSYLVNLHAISSISGNALGYELHLKDYSQRTIPVSRSKIEGFNRRYKELGSA